MAEQRELKRSLGLLDATSLVAGSMIGSGIFLVSADMARDVGSAGWMLLAWLLMDDAVMVHENLLPSLGVPDGVTYLAYVGVAMAWTFRVSADTVAMMALMARPAEVSRALLLRVSALLASAVS